ncbi:MAG: hypothetical protein DKM50_09255 [Candidatus Margulisiibacteriota bacterium]|nr:MAG: hypothetical protein A2X43_02145 [Candidatus Margulisbacteria bacterium GWD2_39_127]OGI00876.1 MAG: hypothetical protein A2X42_03020 [Candidatus Margulisbacteria bacterium GWF2_38_17]OGI08731.1 MAG: hypothetical protein A2X41_05275 [Candidatus Margulisbacteria bacterium GWE2_39_32]PZM79442.1 MAG: hypothetical protein DKM50_09255 [Candidatus Margulisiibacteriota bacterium]HAR63505.1 hypothetical protein [Candidatus Margulisiibacteriota bacterium]
MTYDYDAIVIGGGTAGLAFAVSAVSLKAKVAIIESNKFGGSCINSGCIPSKAFLHSAHVAHQIATAHELGIDARIEKIDLSTIMSRVNHIVDDDYEHTLEKYKKLGVSIIDGRGELLDNHSVKVGDNTYTGEHIIIASGSRPVIPPIKGLTDVPFLTNETIFDMKQLPKNLTILGAGSIGLEFGQGFEFLGSQVSIIDMVPTIFPKDDPEVSGFMERIFSSENINLYLSSSIEEVKQQDGKLITTIEKDGKKIDIIGDAIFASLGRMPNTKNMGLETIGVELDPKGYIKTNAFLQTSIPNIYACGDVVGPYKFTHMANYQGFTIAKNIILKEPTEIDYSEVTWSIYTKPEVAHVGYTEQMAKEANLFGDSIVVNFERTERAVIDSDTGFLKLILDKDNLIIGATLISEKAGDMINTAAVAIKERLDPTFFITLIYSFPTEISIYKYAGLEFLKKVYKEDQRKKIQYKFIE